MIEKTFRRSRGCAAIVALVGVFAVGPAGVRGADHLDGPRLMVNPTVLGNLDINDVYIFQAFNPKHTVLIMTLSPAAGVLGPTAFSTFGAYEFKIENTGDAIEDLTIRFQFAAPDSTGRQFFEYAAVNSAGQALLTGGGITGQNNAVHGGGMVRPGLYDDPFFFDLNAFNRFKARALAGDPTAAQEFLNRGVKNIPQNFFGGFNVLAIVVEVPSVMLQSSARGTRIGVWARTLVPENIQFDRMARPAINTVLMPDVIKDLFNSSIPAEDPAFIPIATDELTKLFGSKDASVHATLLLPDIMSFDTSSRAGFLNGRQLMDDVIDAELALLTDGGVRSDGVVNDSVFLAKFPYLGTPNPKTVTIRAMQQMAAQAQSQGASVPKAAAVGASGNGPSIRVQGPESRKLRRGRTP